MKMSLEKESSQIINSDCFLFLRPINDMLYFQSGVGYSPLSAKA